MKNLSIILISFLFIFLVIGCQNNEDEMTPSGNIKTTAPVISTLSKSEWQLTKPASGENPFVLRLSWSKVRYNYTSGQYYYVSDADYEVQMDLTANNFSNPKRLAAAKDLFTDLKTVDLKTVLDQLAGFETDDAHYVSIRIKAVSEKGISYSEPVQIIISSYFEVNPTLKNIYMIGDMNSWNYNSKDYIMFRSSNNNLDGVCTYTGYFPSTTKMKFISQENLGNSANAYCAGENGILKLGNYDSFSVTAGYHTITIDTKNMKWTITDPSISNPEIYSQMGPIGGFCNWDNEPMMTKSTFDPHQWRINYSFTGSTALKFRGNKNWSNNWGGSDADLPYGKGVFDGPGCTIQNAGTYNIYFNDLTGHYAVIKQ